MVHKEFKNIVPGARRAVLMIHGIVGTPNHFSPFIPLVPDDVSVWNMLLDGHGKGVRDFAATSMSRWEQQVENAVVELEVSHDEILILAHSMGTLFAIEKAMSHRKITRLFLLAVPICVGLRFDAFLNAWRLYTNSIDVRDPKQAAFMHCCGLEQNKNFLSYFGWIPRFMELLLKIREIRRSYPALMTACCIYQSQSDELVSPNSVSVLSENPCSCVKILKDSGHYYYSESDLKLLTSEFSIFIST